MNKTSMGSVLVMLLRSLLFLESANAKMFPALEEIMGISIAAVGAGANHSF